MESEEDKTQTHIALTKGMMASHYRIVEKIGGGGMGEVYLAEDTELDRKVALKFLPSHLCQDEDCRKRFKREAQAAAKLDHPNIVTIHEVGEHKGRPFFAMQHIEGRSLRDVKAEELDIDRIVGIAIQLCDGLQAAHAAGVIHRDIKPSNVVIDSSGRPKLLDFGLATVKGGEHLTKTGSTLGTVGYMSPEQIEGKATDARSDLFSLGVVLYELIANKSPFRRDDETATLKAILQDSPEPMARYKSDVPDDLQRIVSKLLEKDPSLRYQSAAGVIPDLKKLSSTTTASMVIEKRHDRWNRYVVSSAVVILLAVTAVWYFGDSGAEVSESGDEIRLAVLPFENLGGPEDECFAGGITDAITSRLAKISGLSVISRTSAMKYKDTEMSLKQVGAELDVGYVLEGTILWDKSGDTDRVRIIPQLIRVSDDSHVWAEEYERALTQIFAVQTDIAVSIAEKLNIALLEPEREALAEIPTESMEAYHAYLAAGEQDTDSLTVLMYERAISLDPSFALAYADLSWHHSSMYQVNFDRSEERLQLAREAADSALALQPDLPDAHFALGFYYYCGYRDYDKALEEYAIAKKGLPNNQGIFMVEGWIRRRQGRFDEAIDNFTRAFQLNPKSANAAFELATTYQELRNYEEALTYINKAISLNPANELYYTVKIMTHILMGDSRSARRLLANMPSPERVWMMWTYLEMFEGNYDAALEHLSVPQEEVFNAANSIMSVNIWRAGIYDRMGEPELARIACDSARVFLESHKDEYADLVGYHSSLAMAYAGLGQKEEAIRLGRLEMAKFPYSRDVLEGARAEWDMSRIYMLTGEYESAIDLLEHVMSVPFYLESASTLRSSPWWDPLRDHPRFQALIEKCEKEHDL